MRRIVIMLAAALAVAATFALPAGAKSTGLKGEVNDNFQIKLTKNGVRVKTIKAGTYKIKVEDKSSIHNFHLIGPGREQEDERLASSARRTWTIKLKPGRYTYQCDPHASSGMKGTLPRYGVTRQRFDLAVFDAEGGQIVVLAASRRGRACPAQRPMFSTSVRDGRAGADDVGVEDGELVAVVLGVPDLRIVELELEAVRRRGRVSPGLVALCAAVAQQHEPARLVRRLSLRVRDERGAHVRRESPPDGALHRLLDVFRLPEVGGQVLPAAVGEDRDDDAVVELARRACARRARPRRRTRRRRARPRRAGAAPRARIPRSTRAPCGRASRRRGSAARSRRRASAVPSPDRREAVPLPPTTTSGKRLAQALADAHQRAARAETRDDARRRGRARRRSPRRCPRSAPAGSPRSRTGTA